MNRIGTACTITTLATFLALTGCHKAEEPAEEVVPGIGESTATPATEDDNTEVTTPTTGGSMTARAALQDGTGAQVGTVTITQEGNGVRVVADITGLTSATPGGHGFHVHENGLCDHEASGQHFTGAGGHFNPTNAPHACPPDEPRHAGDLGNVELTNGSGRLELTTTGLSLTGANSVVGKAFILHSKADDCKTQPTGDSGERIACGVVTLEDSATAAPTGGTQ